jgi:multicomponent Na+:H+ antiporter subunit D
LWEAAFWKPAPGPAAASVSHSRLGPTILAPIAFLVILTVAITVAAGPLSAVTMRAADQLFDVDGYVHAVLGQGVNHVAR